MPKSSPQELKTKAAYNARPSVTAKRVLNNAARREAIAKGLAKVGDGKDVDHKKMLDAGGTNAPSNLRVLDRKTNRGWRKTSPEQYGKKK